MLAAVAARNVSGRLTASKRSLFAVAETAYSRVETNGAAVRETVVVSLVRSAVHQREDPCLFPRVIERMKPPDFIEAAHSVECVEKTCVAGRKLARLEVTAAQVCVAKCLGTLPGEKVKTQPPPVGRRDALRFSEKGDKK